MGIVPTASHSRDRASSPFTGRRGEEPRSVLVYRIGSLGDTLVALPALWTVRQAMPHAKITLLCDYHPRRRYVLAADLLRGSSVVDEFLLYPVDDSRAGRLLRPLRMLRLLLRLHRRSFDAMVYLAPSRRTSKQIRRDRRFFRAARIRTMFGFDGFVPDTQRQRGVPMPVQPREAERLLERLTASGLTVPEGAAPRFDLDIGTSEQKEVDRWLGGQQSDGGRPWISVGPGSKQPVNVWPAERYRAVVESLIDRFDVWPVVFGGPEDAAVGRALTTAWGRGYVACGALGLRASAAAFARCHLHVGNDTGTMHLAAAAGVPIVAVFSSHDPPGEWHPIGEGHRVFRTAIECEGCLLQRCEVRGMQCILSIGPAEVLAACVDRLRTRLSERPQPAVDR